jgi:hypothetical protein
MNAASLAHEDTTWVRVSRRLRESRYRPNHTAAKRFHGDRSILDQTDTSKRSGVRLKDALTEPYARATVHI